MRVLFLTQWFEPEPAFKGLGFAKALSERGCQVTVCTGFPNYPSGRVYQGYRLRAYRREVMDGQMVDRVYLYPSHDSSSAGRALNYLSFFVSSFVYGLLRAGRFDVIYVYHPPITVGLAAALFGLLRRVPFVLDIQDLWPDSVAVSGMASTGRLARLLGPLCDFVYRRAARVVAQSERMRQALEQRGVPGAKLTTIFNWADESAVDSDPPESRDYGFEGRFNLVFAGNLGMVQGLETLVTAAVLAAAEEPSIQLHFIGDGAAAASLKALAAQTGAANVSFHPPVPREAIAAVLRTADVLVAHLRPQPLFAMTLPSKLQFYLAVGRPVLVAIEGEAAEIVEAEGCGVTAAPGDARAVANAMLELSRTPTDILAAMGRRARSAYERRFAFGPALDRTEEVLRAAAA